MMIMIMKYEVVNYYYHYDDLNFFQDSFIESNREQKQTNKQKIEVQTIVVNIVVVVVRKLVNYN